MATNIKSILKLEVPVSVQIAARRMSMRDVANLTPGAIIELPKLADEELEIIVSNRQIGAGTAVKVGENFGVRVTYVGNLSARIKALGGDGVPMTPAPAPAAAPAPALAPEKATESPSNPSGATPPEFDANTEEQPPVADDTTLPQADA